MAEIEVRALGKIYFLFRERGWPCPLYYPVEKVLTARDLRNALEIPAEDVEVVFVNRKVMPLSTPLGPGDRVAFVPPGTPSVHRFNLGFYAARKEKE